MRTRSLLLVAVALLLAAVVPARADEFKPGYLQLTQLDHETYDVLWKIPAIDEVHHAQGEAAVPRRNRGADRGAQHVLARGHGAALAHPCAGRARREGHLLLAALGNPDRRARAARAPGRHRAARAHPAGEPQLRRQAQPWSAGSRHDLYGPRDRTHPVRVRSPAVRARSRAPGAGDPATARHHHGVHGRAQSDACRGNARLGARARAPG